MKYVVDHIVDDIVVLEQIDTKDIIEVNKNSIPFKVKDGNILIKENNSFHLDSEEETKRKDKLQEKLNRLKGDS